jgi:hypothetical protein
MLKVGRYALNGEIDSSQRRREMCGHRHQGYRLVRAWPDDMRAADADREATIDSLRDHAGAGRLDAEELDQRLEAALRATTLGALRALVGDLPGPAPRFGPGRERSHRRGVRAQAFANAWWAVPLGAWGIASALGAH